jgi:multidrug efflux pump subunit AcrA (membrane-fusion protein)
MLTLTRVRLCLAVLILALPLLVAGCRFGRGTPDTPDIVLPSLTPQAAAAPVTYPVTAAGEVVQLETFSGRVIPGRQEDLFFRRSGQIAEVYISDGDFIEAGELIATLDNEVLEIDLESALLGLAIAKENLTQAEEALTIRREQAQNSLAITRLRLQGASDRVDTNDSTLSGSILEEIRQLEIRQAELNLENVSEEVDPVLQLNLQRAELAVERVKRSILEGQIEAPFSGEIRFINLPEDDEPMAASAYSGVARLVDMAQVKVELNLTRTQLETLVEGMPVAITAASLTNRTIDGVISALPRPFGTSQGSLTEVSLANAADGSQLREGISVGVEVRLQSKPGALIIPRSTLQEENQLYYVTLFENEQLRRVNVAVGVVSADYVEIIAGLSVGDLVVDP